jgi:ubiquinone/menaquinone biosynthesis C-methylase UbiE
MDSIFNIVDRKPLKKPFSAIDVARAYDLGMRKSALMSYQKPANRVLEKANNDMTDIVEVGVNTGLMSLYIGGKLPDVPFSGVEENQILLEVAEENLNLAVWSSNKGDIEFEASKFAEMPFEDDSADIVFSFSSLHMWKRPVETLKECERICKPEGTVIIEDLNRATEEGHITFVLQFVKEGGNEFIEALGSAYTPSEVRALLNKAGLEDWLIYVEDLGLVIASKPLDSMAQMLYMEQN